MTVYYVDDGGSATAPYDTWGKAATSLSALDDAVSLASGDIVYIGHDHVCQFTHSANRTITGPTSGAPTVIISATQGSTPPSYQASTSAQVDTTEGAYAITFDGSFALYGVKIVSGANIEIYPDTNEYGYCESCTFSLGANGTMLISDAYGRSRYVNCTIDISSDSTTPRSSPVVLGESVGQVEIVNLSFIDTNGAVGGSYRTGSIFTCDGIGRIYISGCDFSGFDNATLCEVTNQGGFVEIANCKLAATWGVAGGTARYNQRISLTNCHSADAPEALYVLTSSGYVQSSSPYETSVYRSGGQSVESTAVAWKMVSNSSTTCIEAAPLYTPWIYGTISATGSKTFTVYVANNTADLYDDECWLEVEYLGTANIPLTTLATDQRATITTTRAVQTDDTGSTWNGTTLTYMQSLAVTATVNEDGVYRARVALAKASATVYVDPKVTVT